MEGDLTTLDPRDFAPVRGLIASPPCQTFSVGGKGAGRRALETVLLCIKAIGAGEWPADLIAQTGDTRTALVLQPLHWALALRPEWLAWEQVPTVLPVWEACAEVLRSEGYHVDTGILSAGQFGVSQVRKRAFLVARRDRPVSLPKPTHSRFHSRHPERLDPGTKPWVSMVDAVGWGYVDRPAPTVMSTSARGGPRGIDGGSGGWRAVVAAQKEGRWIPRPGYGRPGSRGELTTVPIPDLAALQSFPADYPWQGNASEITRQIGNAVPPALGHAVLAEVIGDQHGA